MLCPTPFSHPESSCPSERPPCAAQGLSPSPAALSPWSSLSAPQRGLLTHPTSSPLLSLAFLSALPPPTVSNTKPWGFLHHYSFPRGAFPPFPRSQKLSFLRRKRGRNIGGCMELCCPCPTLLVHTMMYLNLPWGSVVRV